MLPPCLGLSSQWGQALCEVSHLSLLPHCALLPAGLCAPAYGLVCSSPQAAQRTSAPLPLLPAACPLLLFPSSFKQIPPSSKTRLGPRGNSYTASSLDPSWKDPGLGPGLWRPLDIIRASLVPQTVKNLPAMREARVFWSLGREEPLQKGMAAHSSILAWRISRTEEPGGLQCMGSQSQCMAERLTHFRHHK